MAFRRERLTFLRVFKSALIAVGLVTASVSLWNPQLLDDLPLCMSSLATPGSGGAEAATATPPTSTATPPAATATPPAAMKHDATSSDMHAPTVFTLRTGIAEGRMVYIGVGGDINGAVNPTLVVHEGETVQINLINGEGAEHDIVIDQYGARSSRVIGKGASSAVTFTASKTGEFFYYCSAPGLSLIHI